METRCFSCVLEKEDKIANLNITRRQNAIYGKLEAWKLSACTHKKNMHAAQAKGLQIATSKPFQYGLNFMLLFHLFIDEWVS